MVGGATTREVEECTCTGACIHTHAHPHGSSSLRGGDRLNKTRSMCAAGLSEMRRDETRRGMQRLALGRSVLVRSVSRENGRVIKSIAAPASGEGLVGAGLGL